MKAYSTIIKEKDLVFISGILPDIFSENQDNAYLQAKSIFNKLNDIITKYDLKNYHVANTKLFLHNIKDITEVNNAYFEYFGENLPSRSALGGVDLVNNVLVEIEFTMHQN